MLQHGILRRAPLCGITLLLTLLALAADRPEPAPRFHAKTLTGENFSNEPLKGKVVLLQFWTTWCPYCRSEEALVDSINQEFAGKDLVVLAIDVGESKKKVSNTSRSIRGPAASC